MRVIRYCILSALLVLAPAVALAQDTITFGVGYTAMDTDYTMYGAGASGGTPSADDTFVVPNGAYVVIMGDVQADGATQGWQIQSGGHVMMSALFGYPGSPKIYEHQEGRGSPARSLYEMAGSELELQGCYVEIGPASPQCVGYHSATNNTTGTVGNVGACDGAAGVVGDCGADPEKFTLHYAEVGGVDGQEIAAALALVTADETELCFYDPDSNDDYKPALTGQCFTVIATDAVDPSSITIDITQPGNAPSAEFNGYTEAMRQQYALNIYADAAQGATCVEVDAGVIAADGDYKGRPFRIEGSGYPILIKNSLDQTDCSGSDTSGGDAQDSIYFSERAPLPEAVADEDDASIDIMARRGDPFFLMNPVIFKDETAAEDDGIMRFSGESIFDGVVWNGNGKLDFWDGTLTRLDDIVIRNCGLQDAACLELDDYGNIDSHFIMISGGHSATGEALPILIEDAPGTVRMTDITCLYGGDYCISSNSGDTTEGFIGRNISSLYADPGGNASGAFSDADAVFSSSKLTNVTCIDGSAADGFCVEGSDTKLVDARNVVDFASSERISTGLMTHVRNLLVDGLTTDATAALFSNVHRCEITDVTDVSFAGAEKFNSRGLYTMEDCIFRRPFTNQSDLFENGYGNINRNVVVIDPDTSSGSCASRCGVFTFWGDSDSDTHDILSYITITTSPGFVSTFNVGVDIASGISSEDDAGIYGGSWLVDGFDSDGATAGYALYILGAAIVKWDFQYGDVCATGNSHTTAWLDITAESEDEWAILGQLHRGISASFADEYSYLLTPGSLVAEKKCGAKTGTNAPGLRGRETHWMTGVLGGDVARTVPARYQERKVY